MYQKPNPKQLEVSTFGPGRGESIVVHLGDDKWLIVDSCRDRKTKKPAALNYLKSLGVNIKKDVLLIITTHWHDDHILGLSDCVRECEGARFCCSAAYQKEDFIEMIQGYSADRIVKGGTGASEMSQVFDVLAERGDAAVGGQADKLLLNQTIGGNDCKVWALSPSDEQMLDFYAAIAEIKLKIGSNRQRAPSNSPNHSCVVILIEAGEQSILLGADHEETTSDGTGWTAILDSPVRSKTKSSIYKIAHHGSENAHVDRVWEEMLVEYPNAVLTPFSSSSLPRDEMVGKILKKTDKAYSTALVRDVKTNVKRGNAVERQMKAFTENNVRAESNTGHVRMRNMANNDANKWETELFSGACHLDKL